MRGLIQRRLLWGIALGLLSLRPPASLGQTQINLAQYASYQFHTLRNPTGLAYTQGGPDLPSLYIADTEAHVIRRFYSGALQIVAGVSGSPGYVDGTGTSAKFYHPTGLSAQRTIWHVPGGPYNSFDSINVGDTTNYVIRSFCIGIPPSGTCGSTSTAAGNHIKGLVNGSTTAAEFASLSGLTFNTNTYIADSQNHAIRMWAGSTISTFAGTGTSGFVNGYRTSAQFNSPTRVAFDNSGNMYVADAGNNVIRKIDTSGTVTTFAGSGITGHADGAGTSAQFNCPASIVFNPADGFLYVADMMNNEIRRIDSSGNVTTYAGAPTGGLVNGSLSQARFGCPADLVIENGFMLIADSMNNAIRQIDMVHLTVTTYIS